jgi:hypothetical protein
MKRCHGRLHYDRKFKIFIFLIGYINVNKGVFCLIISYLRIKSYNVLNYNNCSTDWSFPLRHVFLPHALVTLADFGYSVYDLWFSCSQRFQIILLENYVYITITYQHEEVNELSHHYKTSTVSIKKYLQ